MCILCFTRPRIVLDLNDQTPLPEEPAVDKGVSVQIERAAVDLAEHLLERQLHGDVKSDSHTMLSSY